MSQGRNETRRRWGEHSRRDGSDRVIRPLSTRLMSLCGILFALGMLAANAQGVTDDLKPLRFEGYPNAREAAVVPRKDDLFFYPCNQCHAAMEANPEIRQLNAMHTVELEHGRGRIWCTSCHNLENRNYLSTLLDEPVDFDEAYLVCGGCHANRHKDWIFGAHGKRVANWQGERTLYNCTHCHDAHNPTIKPRAPKAAPPVRAGLTLQRAIEHEKSHVWDSQEEHEQQ